MTTAVGGMKAVSMPVGISVYSFNRKRPLDRSVEQHGMPGTLFV